MNLHVSHHINKSNRQACVQVETTLPLFTEARGVCIYRGEHLHVHYQHLMCATRQTLNLCPAQCSVLRVTEHRTQSQQQQPIIVQETS